MELIKFLRWCVKVANTDQKDSLGNSMRNTRFPYGEVAYWVREYEHARDVGEL